MLLTVLLPVWLLEGLTAWAGWQENAPGAGIGGEASLALHLVVLPGLAAVLVASRGGSHIARAAAGLSVAGASLVAFALICPAFGAYQYIVLSDAIAAPVQALVGWIAGTVTGVLMRRLGRTPPRKRIERLDAAGTCVLLLGAWLIAVGAAFLGPLFFFPGLVTVAAGGLMIYKAAFNRRFLAARPSEVPPPLNKKVIASVVAVVVLVPVGIMVLMARSLVRGQQESLAFLCANLGLEELRASPGAVARDQMLDFRVKVRAREAMPVYLGYVELADGLVVEGERTLWVHGRNSRDEEQAVLKPGVAQDLEGQFRMIEPERGVIERLALCRKRGEEDLCVWFGPPPPEKESWRRFCGAVPRQAPLR